MNFRKKLKEDIKLINSSKKFFFQQIKPKIFMKLKKKIMKKSYMRMSQKHTKNLMSLYQKRLIKKQNQLQKALMSQIDLISWQNKSAL